MLFQAGQALAGLEVLPVVHLRPATVIKVASDTCRVA
jgi:hypothetical protein